MNALFTWIGRWAVWSAVQPFLISTAWTFILFTFTGFGWTEMISWLELSLNIEWIPLAILAKYSTMGVILFTWVSSIKRINNRLAAEKEAAKLAEQKAKKEAKEVRKESRRKIFTFWKRNK